MRKIAFIWDLDGTLIDSYQAIVEALKTLYSKYDLIFDDVAVTAYILKESVGSLLQSLSKEYQLDCQELLAFFNAQQEARDHMIRVMPFAKEALQFAQDRGIENFIYTHKGASTFAVLEELGLAAYFTEVLTAASGFERKPHPQAISYLLNKYTLDKAETYYIGDRRLDVEAAENAGIQSINLKQADSLINRKIKDLSELEGLFSAS